MYGCLLIHSRKCSRACSFRFSSSRSSSFAFTRNLSDSIAAKLFYTQKWEMKRKKTRNCETTKTLEQGEDFVVWVSESVRKRWNFVLHGSSQFMQKKTFWKFRFQHVTSFHQWPRGLALSMHCKVCSRTFIACSITDLRFSIFDSSILNIFSCTKIYVIKKKLRNRKLFSLLMNLNWFSAIENFYFFFFVSATHDSIRLPMITD